eukprot:9265467-Pyramimonas_sp.AAC.1
MVPWVAMNGKGAQRAFRWLALIVQTALVLATPSPNPQNLVRKMHAAFRRPRAHACSSVPSLKPSA